MKALNSILLLLLFQTAFSQVLEGEVSYLSASNVYVRFTSTSTIETGDTLYSSNDLNTPCLKVLRKSSLSVLCEPISDCDLSKGQKLFLAVSEKSEEAHEPISESVKTEPSSSEQDSLAQVQRRDPQFANPPAQSQHFRARFSYDNMTNYRMDDWRGSTRNVLRTSITWDSLAQRDIRLEGYFNIQHFLRNYESSADPYRINFYNLALISNFGKQSLVLGRRVNRRISSIGAIDGLQYEYAWEHFKLGAIAGSRPDFENFGYNPNLMQFGAYAAYDLQKGKVNLESTLGIVQQNNNGAIDRRYIYTQNSLAYGSWFWFSSAEIDLYQNFDTASAQSDFKLSSLYLSLRYRFNSRLSLFGSYDSRQQIIFFEQFDSEIERILSDQGMRQGLRFRLNYRQSRSTNLGLAYNLRLASDANEGSTNYSAYVSQRLPWVGGTLSYRFNLNQAYFLSSEVNSLRYARYWNSNQLYTAVYYRYLSYLYPQREIVLDPIMYMGGECSYRFKNDWSLAVIGEYSLNYQENLIRINLRLTKNLKF